MEEHDALKHALYPRIIPRARMVKNKNFKAEANELTAMILTKYLQYCCLVESTLSLWGFAHQDLNGHAFFEIFLGSLVCQNNLRLPYSADAVFSFPLDHKKNHSHRGLKRT
mgnify:CR=1 FL=1